MEEVGKVIKGAVAILAMVPGVAMLANAVPVPPPGETVISVVTLAVGVAIVIAIALAQRLIRSMPAWALAVAVLALGILGALAAVRYADFAQTHIVEFTDAQRQKHSVVVPAQPSAELSSILRTFNGDYAEAMTNPIRGHRVQQLVRDEGGATTTWLVLYLLAAQILLVTAVVAGAWKIAQPRAPNS